MFCISQAKWATKYTSLALVRAALKMVYGSAANLDLKPHWLTFTETYSFAAYEGIRYPSHTVWTSTISSPNLSVKAKPQLDHTYDLTLCFINYPSSLDTLVQTSHPILYLWRKKMGIAFPCVPELTLNLSKAARNYVCMLLTSPDNG